MSNEKAKKVTLATIKSFIRKNPDLLILTNSSFDGRYDCCMPTGSKVFTKAERTEDHVRNTLGVRGAWFVGDSRDYFTPFAQNGVQGYEVSNCCGNFKIGVAA